MLILNFTHPITPDQRAQIEALASTHISDIRTIPVRINHDASLADQITDIINSIGLSSQEWQSLPLLINLPGYTPAAFVLLAQLHGRIGHFPTFILLRPKHEVKTKHGARTTYEVVELLNLQHVRETARTRR